MRKKDADIFREAPRTDYCRKLLISGLDYLLLPTSIRLPLMIMALLARLTSVILLLTYPPTCLHDLLTYMIEF